MDDLQQLAYERRIRDVCALVALHALITDSDPSSRRLSVEERISLANDYAELWAKSRGYGDKEEPCCGALSSMLFDLVCTMS